MVLSFFRRAKRPAEEVGEDVSLASAIAGPDTLGSAFLHATALGLDGSGFVRYSWMLDHTMQIVGYHMQWVARADQAELAPHTKFQALVWSLAESFLDRHRGWALGRTGILLDASPEAVHEIDWHGLPEKHIVLRWTAEDFGNPEHQPLLAGLREQGFGMMLTGEVPEAKELRDLITHYDVGAGDPLALATCRSISRRSVHPVATSMPDWTSFDACAARRVPVLVRPSIAPPPPRTPRGKLQPETVLIVRVLQMVQKNEDVREIEAALKHDAALTFRFLRHISSPAVGVGVEIESLRHAVAMLGYQRLFRWLSSLLLATKDAKLSPPFLMKKAIIRGRFVELLGLPLLGARDADNLFLVGMFSVIDQVLGMPMEELLERVQLAEAVQLGLKQEGVYGPFLRVALGSEAGDDMDAMVDELLISAAQVNAAHLAAIAWSQEISHAEF